MLFRFCNALLAANSFKQIFVLLFSTDTVGFFGNWTPFTTIATKKLVVIGISRNLSSRECKSGLTLPWQFESHEKWPKTHWRSRKPKPVIRNALFNSRIDSNLLHNSAVCLVNTDGPWLSLCWAKRVLNSKQILEMLSFLLNFTEEDKFKWRTCLTHTLVVITWLRSSCVMRKKDYCNLKLIFWNLR